MAYTIDQIRQALGLAPSQDMPEVTVTGQPQARPAAPQVPFAPIPPAQPRPSLAQKQAQEQAQQMTDPDSYPNDHQTYGDKFEKLLAWAKRDHDQSPQRQARAEAFADAVVKDPAGLVSPSAWGRGLSSAITVPLDAVRFMGEHAPEGDGIGLPLPAGAAATPNPSEAWGQFLTSRGVKETTTPSEKVAEVAGMLFGPGAAIKGAKVFGEGLNAADSLAMRVLGTPREMGRDAGAVRMGGGKAPKSVNENIPKSFVQKLSDADLDQQIAEGFRKEGGFMGGDADALNKAYMKELQAEKLLRTPDVVKTTAAGRGGNPVDPALETAPKLPMKAVSPLAPKEVMPGDPFSLSVEKQSRATGKGSLTPTEQAQAAALADEHGIPRADVRKSFSELKKRYPTTDGWSPLEVSGIERDTGTKKITFDGEGLPVLKLKENPYNFHKVIGFDDERASAQIWDQTHLDRVAGNLANEVTAVADRAAAGDKNASVIMNAKDWYRQMRDRLRQEYGGFADTLADTLGTTSAQTGVRQNWDNAVEALSQFSRGAYDRALGKLDAFLKAGGDMGSSGTKNGTGYINMHQAAKEAAMPDALKQAAAEGINDPTRLAARAKEIAFQTAQAGDYPIITKGDGKTLFNANSPATMMAFLDKFRDFSAGGSPKTPNFTGNLIGYSPKATIDVWAARLLRRLSGRPRIVPGAEPGVKGEFTGTGLETNGEFGFGQEVFKRAAEKLRQDPRFAGLGDDDLQAIAWFLEKEHWTKNNWTSAAGEGGSLENEANYAGFADREKLKEYRSAYETDPTAGERRKLAAAIADPKEFEAAKAALAEKGWILDASPAKRRNEIMDRLGIADKLEAQTVAGKILDEARSAAKTIKGYESKQNRIKTLLDRSIATKTQAGSDLENAKAIIDRWAGGLSPETTSIPATPEMFAKGQYDLSQQLNSDPLVVMHKALPSRGRYISPVDGKIYDENSYDMEFLTRKGFDPTNVWREMVKQAKDRGQESVFLSKVVKPGTVPTANPGIEVWFKSTLKDADVEALIAKMHKSMPDVGFTFVSNLRGKQRLAGGANTGEYVGLRAQYIPEYGGGVEGIEAAKDKLTNAVENISKYDGVSNAKYVEYDTQVSTGAAEHDRHIAGDVPTGREASWRGQLRSEAVRGADPYAGSEPGSVGRGNLRDGGKGPNP